MEKYGISMKYIILVFLILTGCNEPEIAKPRIDPLIDTKLRPIDNMSLEYFWSESIGAKVNGNFTIKNANEFTVKDIDIVCHFYANSGTRIGNKKFTLYEKFPPEEIITVKDFNIGFVDKQTVKVRCNILY